MGSVQPWRIDIIWPHYCNVAILATYVCINCLQNNPEVLSFIRDYTSMGYGSLLLFMFLGSVLTVIVQSSSATVAITLIMCTQGWIPFEMAAAMVLGENIGTTITANIAAISANTSARRAALAHLMFNLFGVCWMMLLFYPFSDLCRWKSEIGRAHV